MTMDRKPWVIRWKFEDSDVSQSVADFEQQVLNLNATMATSDDPVLRLSGREYLRDIAQLAATVRQSFEDQSRRNSRNAKRPRTKRGKAPKTVLLERGLECVLRRYPDITAGRLCDMLEAEKRIAFEDDDIELRIAGESIVVRNLRTRAEVAMATISADSLRTYLSSARKT